MHAAGKTSSSFWFWPWSLVYNIGADNTQKKQVCIQRKQSANNHMLVSRIHFIILILRF